VASTGQFNGRRTTVAIAIAVGVNLLLLLFLQAMTQPDVKHVASAQPILIRLKSMPEPEPPEEQLEKLQPVHDKRPAPSPARAAFSGPRSSAVSPATKVSSRSLTLTPAPGSVHHDPIVPNGARPVVRPNIAYGELHSQVTLPAQQEFATPPSNQPSVRDLGDVDSGPSILKRVEPEYPVAARRFGLKGAVTVGFIVQADGTVREAVVESSTSERFESSALAAVRQWRFKPAADDGQPVAVRCRMTLRFELK
jgi:protein TonB